jgi:small subunit ribosomal protein S3
LKIRTLRKYLKKRLYHAGISRIQIARTGEKIRVKLHTARPGIVIGKKGSEIDTLKADLERRTGRSCALDIQEVADPRPMPSWWPKTSLSSWSVGLPFVGP